MRSYRGNYSEEDTFEIMQKDVNVKFNPDIFDIMQKIFRQLH